MTNPASQFFERDSHRIILGDVLEVLPSIPNRSIDLIFADTPYNIGKDFNGRKDKWASDEEYLKVIWSSIPFLGLLPLPSLPNKQAAVRLELK